MSELPLVLTPKEMLLVAAGALLVGDLFDEVGMETVMTRFEFEGEPHGYERALATLSQKIHYALLEGA